jgi:hypothetical protein
MEKSQISTVRDQNAGMEHINSRADDPFYSKSSPFWTRVAAA